MADSVCSILSFKNEEPYDQDIRKRMNSLNNSKRNLFFYYEGRDDFYDKAVRAYIRKDMITALAEVYNGRHWSEPVVKSYYRKKWYAIIEKKVLNAMVISYGLSISMPPKASMTLTSDWKLILTK